MNRRITMAALMTIGGLGIGALAAPPRDVPIEHLTAKIAVMTSPARLTLKPVDIVISRWSSYNSHLALAETLLDKGPVTFMNVLCGYEPVGTISVMDAPPVAIRYAWFIEERGGSQRLYLATDEPVSLTGAAKDRSSGVEPLTFIEIRVDRNGVGEGKLSEAANLSVDENRNIIQLRDYDQRPLHLIKVHSDHLFEE